MAISSSGKMLLEHLPGDPRHGGLDLGLDARVFLEVDGAVGAAAPGPRRRTEKNRRLEQEGGEEVALRSLAAEGRVTGAGCGITRLRSEERLDALKVPLTSRPRCPDA